MPKLACLRGKQFAREKHHANMQNSLAFNITLEPRNFQKIPLNEFLYHRSYSTLPFLLSRTLTEL